MSGRVGSVTMLSMTESNLSLPDTEAEGGVTGSGGCSAAVPVIDRRRAWLTRWLLYVISPSAPTPPAGAFSDLRASCELLQRTRKPRPFRVGPLRGISRTNSTSAPSMSRSASAFWRWRNPTATGGAVIYPHDCIPHRHRMLSAENAHTSTAGCSIVCSADISIGRSFARSPSSNSPFPADFPRRKGACPHDDRKALVIRCRHKRREEGAT